MPGTALQFGFLPYRDEYSSTDISITLNDDFDNIIGDGLDDRIWNGWYYPPLENRQKRGIPGGLLRPEEVTILYMDSYVLPNTHTFRHRRSNSQTRSEFLIVVFGFIFGMRLIPEGWQNLSRVPIQKRIMSSVVLTKRETSLLLQGYDAFFDRYPRRTINALHRAIHAYQWASITEHWFERFTYLCMSLDAVTTVYFDQLGDAWRSRDRNGNIYGQWSYARDLCDLLNIAIPYWARKHPTRNRCTLSVWRNANFHDAQIMEQPFGFVLDHRFWDVMLDLEHLLFRAILNLTGVRCGFTSSPITDRQLHGLNLR